LFISEIVHTEDSFLLKLYYKFNFATEPNKLYPYYLVDQAIQQHKVIPELLIMCGTEDELYEDNKKFINYLDYCLFVYFVNDNYTYVDKEK